MPVLVRVGLIGLIGSECMQSSASVPVAPEAPSGLVHVTTHRIAGCARVSGDDGIENGPVFLDRVEPQPRRIEMVFESNEEGTCPLHPQRFNEQQQRAVVACLGDPDMKLLIMRQRGVVLRLCARDLV